MSGKHWASEPTAFLEPKIGKSGSAAFEPKTIIDVFKETVASHGNRKALFLKRAVKGEMPSDFNMVWTWQEYWNDCCKFAKTLIHLGCDKFTIVNILGFNSPEWLIANNGAIFASCIAAGIYATNLPEACHYITSHSKAQVVVVENNKQLQKYASDDTNKLTHLKAFVVYADEQLDPAIVANLKKPVYLWKDFLALGEKVLDSELEARFRSVSPGNCSTLIYTSGTTGPPKAVMVSHDNITWVAKNFVDNFLPNRTFEERVASYLPLSHIAAQCIDIHIPMYLGGSLYFCQPDAMRGSLTVTLREVKPTLFLGVPRVWEKIQEKMIQIGREVTGFKKTISTWAKSLGTEKSRLAQIGNEGGEPWGFFLADHLVFHKVKEALGLEQAICFSSAAPLNLETQKYFAALDIPVYEIFGQSECTGPHTVNSSGKWKMGSCGRPLPGTENKIDPVTGELCYRGRHIFMGYMYMPSQTAETIDDDGWLHSGDVAEFDEHRDPEIEGPSGFMNITGRIKELIITAGGENVPPVLIEDQMKSSMPAISNCMVIGDRRKYLSMLITLKTELDKDTTAPTDKLTGDALFASQQMGSTATTLSEVASDPLWTKYFNDGVKRANSKTASNAQVVQKWRLLQTDFTERGGELTPTLKLKRGVTAKKYDALIDAIYAEDGEEK